MNEGRGAVDTPHSRDDVFDTVQGLHFRLPEAAEAVPLAVGRHEYIVIVQVGDKVGPDRRQGIEKTLTGILPSSHPSPLGPVAKRR